MPSITPKLRFDGNAEEAAAFYASVSPDGAVTSMVRSPGDNPSPRECDALLASSTVAGMPFTGINGGPQFRFSEAVSFETSCDDQAEADEYWEALAAGGGEHSMCEGKDA